MGGSNWLIKLGYITKILVLYGLTITFAAYLLQPLSPLKSIRPVSLTRAEQRPHVPLVAKINTISGLPVRLVIPGSSLDVPIDPGYYNASDGSWTLSGYRAQFAMVSTLANNQSGETFIYGHNNDFVFGALRHVTPSPGALAFIYTDNNHIFEYSFVSTASLSPDDVSVLSYQGAPMLTIQTCTGSINEWRTMYNFAFKAVVQ